MKKKNSSDKKQHVEVILVLPLGLEDGIFPWGVHSLSEYLNNTCESTNISIWDFRSDKYFAELHNRYSSLIIELFFSLKEENMDTFLGWTTTNPYTFFGFVACTGEDFFRITGGSKRLRQSCLSDLHSFKREFEAHIIEKIDEYTKEKETIRIWGFSVYDRTLFNSLYIARLIKENDPSSIIILGGDYFNFQVAEETYKNASSFVDGVVTGYGEEVMRKIVSEQQQGNSICNLRIQGLVNDNYTRSQEEPHPLKAVNVPPIYKDFSKGPLISYVQQQETDEIRILSQRGCSWGKCSFCSQLDKDMYFPISFKHLHNEIQEKINSANFDVKDSTIRISFDSDENSIEMFIQFIKYLDNIKGFNMKFDIKLWFQVKSFRKELAEVLNSIDNEKILVFFMLNFESLNFDILKTMRKGHSPLQAIEAAKAIQDCGCTFQSNYFIHFPLENSSGIAQETEILKLTAHLFMPPKGRIMLLPYYGNERDKICQNQEKYRVKIRRLKRDTWLKDVFGIDLPLSIWGCSYEQRLSFGIERLLAYTYHKTIKARDVVIRPIREKRKKKWGKETTQAQGRIEFVSRYMEYHAFRRSLKYHLWKSLHYLVQLFGFRRGKAFRQRTEIFTYLSNIIDADAFKPATKEITKKSWKQDLRKSYFYMENGFLKKEYNGPGKKEKWKIELSSNELNILRYLYWSRKRKDVIETFKDDMSEAEVMKIIHRHIKLGSLVQFKNRLLCVFNDPGYWK